MRTLLAIAVLTALVHPAGAGAISSAYTDLDWKKDCVTYGQAKDGEGDWADLACSGYRGYPVMIAYDDEHLAWWERSKKGVLDNLGHDRRVCIMYANFKAQRDGVLESGFIRFFGQVELIESGPVHQKIFSLLLPREQTHVGADTGIGALVHIERALDARGKQIM